MIRSVLYSDPLFCTQLCRRVLTINHKGPRDRARISAGGQCMVVKYADFLGEFKKSLIIWLLFQISGKIYFYFWLKL